MSRPISDYALISNLRCAALVARDGAIDWMCAPSFDSPACFAALLGSEEHGQWRIAPADAQFDVQRRYVDDTLVLQTDFHCADGVVRLTDTMPIDGVCRVVRRVEGLAGRVDMRLHFAPRAQYGREHPQLWWYRHALLAAHGSERLHLRGPQEMHIDDCGARADFHVAEGDVRDFSLTYYRSDEPIPDPPQVDAILRETAAWWHDWLSGLDYDGPWREAVVRSLIVLKALTHAPTGGMVAAPTTSLPEAVGRDANWDYRYCWLRDAALALDTMVRVGFFDEADHWTRWLLRAVGQQPRELRTLYTIGGCPFVPESEAGWLPGWRDTRPVRLGNAASLQFQMDLRGELIDAFHAARQHGVRLADGAWPLQCEVLGNLEAHWRQPDAGMWELRGRMRHYTHSKVMAWVAFERSIQDARAYGFDGPVDHWCSVRDAIREDIIAKGTHPDTGGFVQTYEGNDPDAGLLMLPLVGFLPADDPRCLATIRHIEERLLDRGLVHRFPPELGHAGGEGAFIACAFWLADNYALCGRREDAAELFESLLARRNDVGLLAEEIDPDSGEQLGNFPQSFSHLALVNCARLLSGHKVAPAGE